jgi:hypothetical protein
LKFKQLNSRFKGQWYLNATRAGYYGFADPYSYYQASYYDPHNKNTSYYNDYDGLTESSGYFNNGVGGCDYERAGL